MRSTFTALGLALMCLALTAESGLALWPQETRQTASVGAATPATVAASSFSYEEANAVIEQYCLQCHNDWAETGGLSLQDFDVARAPEQPELAEKMIRKLQAEMMPPSYAERPPAEVRKSLMTALETRLDEAFAADPDPGGRVFQRLNRPEYARAIEELLALDIDPGAYLPPDTMSEGFDNVADMQGLSATLMDGYLRAANEISRLAVGDPDASPAETTYKVPKTRNQMVHIEGTPLGTRGGTAVVHNFPADGEYVFKVNLHVGPTGNLFGRPARNERIDIAINGERVALLEVDRFMSESTPGGTNLQTEPISVRAGPQRLSAAFVENFVGTVNDLMAPQEFSLADTDIGTEYGITSLPHLRRFTVRGPLNATGVSDTPSRRKIFTCRPTAPGEEMACAREIISGLAEQAYRRPLTEDDLGDLMSFYEQGSTEGNFEDGIRTALKAILASPHFVFRIEEVAPTAQPGDPFTVNQLDLASRLSYFLWATGPDQELIQVAEAGGLSDPETLQDQVLRMLEDPRAEALATRFAAQWLRLQDLEKIHPDALNYHWWDRRLSQAMRRETELLFHHLVQEDRSVLELLTADYTFVNERLAEHYDIPGVAGTRFRRVELEDEARQGLLGHGSILMLTSHANRTSPVLRGKWVLEVLMGTPPPPPPPDVPDLEETGSSEGGRMLTVREQMEMHRSNPVCQSCHRVIDPVGLALENFDVTGKWRIKDRGVPVETSTELWDGTPVEGPLELREALLDKSERLVTNFTENLLAYGLGRRVDYSDMPTVREIVRQAESDDYRVSSFILGIVESQAFQTNKAMQLTDDEPERESAPQRDF